MGVFAKCFVYGRLQIVYCVGVCSTYPAIAGFPTQHTLKAIDYQVYKLYQSAKTLTKFMMQKRF